MMARGLPATSLYQEVLRRGGTLIRAGPDALDIQGPPAQDPAILEALKLHKSALLEMLNDPPNSRPAALPEQRTNRSGRAAGSLRGSRIELRAEAAPAAHYFTITLNAVYDEIMPTLRDSAWKILCYLIRTIDGEPGHRDSRTIAITIGGIMERTKKSRNTVKADLAHLVERGCITYSPPCKVGGEAQPAVITLTIPRFVSSRQ